MTDQILEIIQRNYDKFTGTNEAELHAAEEIADKYAPMMELAEWIVKNKRSSVLESADIPQESIIKILHHFGHSAQNYTG